MVDLYSNWCDVQAPSWHVDGAGQDPRRRLHRALPQGRSFGPRLEGGGPCGRGNHFQVGGHG
jgi:hypothetical protein